MLVGTTRNGVFGERSAGVEGEREPAPESVAASVHGRLLPLTATHDAIHTASGTLLVGTRTLTQSPQGGWDALNET
jgi:hypothetical protein